MAKSIKEIFLGNQDCKATINYDGNKLDVSGIKTPDSVSIDIGSIGVEKTILQTATRMAQIYDMYRVSNCQKSKQMQEGPLRDRFLYESSILEFKLIQFSMLLDNAMQNPSKDIAEAIAQWIATNSKEMGTLAPVNITVTKAGGYIIREDPPKMEYEDMLNSLGKAKIHDDYLNNLLENNETSFSMENVLDRQIKA